MKAVRANLTLGAFLALIMGCRTSPNLIEQYAGQQWVAATAASGAPPRSIHGEWRFVYMNKPLLMFGKDFSPPPSFDVIDFRTNGTVRLVNSMQRHDIVGTYTLDGDKVRWKFNPPTATNVVQHTLIYSWGERGRALVLRVSDDDRNNSTDVEWTYYRPDRFLGAEGFVGKWRTVVEGKEADMTFESDGRFYMDGKKCWGYYRLWSSNHGNTLTTPIWIQGEGAFIVNYLYRIESGKMFLVPLTHEGPNEEATMVWSRATSEAPRPGRDGLRGGNLPAEP